jgi:hypothetical protein
VVGRTLKAVLWARSSVVGLPFIFGLSRALLSTSLFAFSSTAVMTKRYSLFAHAIYTVSLRDAIDNDSMRLLTPCLLFHLITWLEAVLSTRLRRVLRFATALRVTEQRAM